MQKAIKRQGRPTREEAAVLADRILATARAVFCEQGVAGASMDAIAAASGVTKHTIYRRFPGKMALVDAVVQQDFALLSRTVEAARLDPDPVAALRETVRGYFIFGIQPENTVFATFLLAEAAYSQEMRDYLARWHELFLAPMVAHTRAAQDAGRLAPGPAEDWCHLVMDLLGYGARRMSPHWNDLSSPARAEKFFEWRWRIFCVAAGIDDGPNPVTTGGLAPA